MWFCRAQLGEKKRDDVAPVIDAHMIETGDSPPGARGDADHRGRPVVPSIVQAVTFQASSVAELQALVGGTTFYGRHGNPTVALTEDAIAALEEAPCALAFGSGMAAITTTLIALLRAGDHLVAQEQLYGATFDFVRHWLPRLGVEVTLVDARVPDSFGRAVRPNTRVIYVESPTNPLLGLVDLRRIAELARTRQLVSVVDSTFASPINQRPHRLGIDVVAHAATKYLSGHSDLLAGAVTTSAQIAERLHPARTCLGGVLDPHAAWLLLRGLKTLALRVERQNASALRIADFLSRDERIGRVYYPYHHSHPQHRLARRQMLGGGGVVSFELAADPERTRLMVEGLRRFRLAVSLGGVESLVTIPACGTHAVMSPDERAAAGVSDQLVRLAVGIEPVEDLIDDLSQALNLSFAGARREAMASEKT